METTTVLSIILITIILLFTGLLFIGITSLLRGNEPIPYKYQCHKCKKKFRESDLKDLRGSWHTKDWTCPHCNHQNVTLKSYDY